MFIFTARVNVRKIVITAALAVALCATAAVMLLLGPRQAQAAAVIPPKGVKTAEDRVSYLQSWGWQVSPEEVTVEELVLPEKFGEEYASYLALQEEMGFDLKAHAGERVKRYTYDVLNHPGGTAAQAHLLVRRNTVLGGEIVGKDFIHSLAMPG